ncbi:MAG: ABC transporter ATP-binding protein [Oscillospiraceae bacterium]|nr:ABC transporter ATP-binding protein [Oscillospiraceae bacterium]
MLLSVDNISFGYTPDKMILKNVSFSLNPGDVMTVLGPNGVGKSTLFDCLCRIKTPQSGTTHIDGIPIEQYSKRQLASVVTLVTQKVHSVFDFTVRDFVVMGCAPRISMFGKPSEEDYADAEEAMADIGITAFSNRIFTQLSGGEQQQVTIAKAIAQKPKIILFDEPTSALDVGNQQKVLRLVRKMADSGYAIIMTTHNPEHAIQLGGICTIMHPDGYMVSGPPEESLKEDLLTDIYKTPLRVLEISELGRYACLAPKLHRQEGLCE